MITNDAQENERQQELETSSEAAAAATASCHNQVAIPVTNHSVVNVPRTISSDDEWSTSDEEDDDNKKQVAEVTSQTPTENGQKIINTYTDCTNVTSTVNNTTIYKDGVTVNHNVYCCPASLDYVLKWRPTKWKIVIFIASLLGILTIILLGLWLSNLGISTQPEDTESEKEPQSTTIIIPSSSTTTTETIPSSSTDSTTSIGTTTENSNGEWKIIRRQDWKAVKTNYTPVFLPYLPPMYVIFSETGTDTCVTTQNCMETVRNIQASHIQAKKADIDYNFLIGGDGMVYEGLGWDVYAGIEHRHTDFYDDLSISVSFIGKFDIEEPTEIILQAAKTFLQFGSQIGKLVGSPKLKCLTQLSYTIHSPGDKMYDIIKMWKGWDSRTIQSHPGIRPH